MNRTQAHPILALVLAPALVLASAPALSAQVFDVSQYDPGSLSYVPLGTIEPFATGSSLVDYYGYDINNPNLEAGAPALVDDAVHVFLVDSAPDGLGLMYTLDRPGGTSGRSELRFTLAGAPHGSRWLVEDDITVVDTFTGIPGDSVYTAEQIWSVYSDGGVIGDLSGCPLTVEMEFTDVESPPSPGNETNGLTTWVVHSGDGSSIALVLDTDRPLRLEARHAYRLRAYLPPEGTWVRSVCITPYETDLSVSDFYGYDGNHYNLGAGMFTPVSNRTHMFLVDSAVDGLSLAYIHDKTSDGSSGRAEMAFKLFGDTDGASWVLKDDPFNSALLDDYTGSPGDSSFTSLHGWNNAFADGGAIGGLDNGWQTLQIGFADFHGNDPGNEMDGLDSWYLYSADDNDIELVLDPAWPIRIDACCWQGGYRDIGCSFPGTAGHPRLLGTGQLDLPGGAGWLSLRDARPNATVLLWVSFGPGSEPFAGGTVKAFPPMISVFLATNADGRLDIPFSWPGGLPADFEICVQLLIDDPGAAFGVAMSNALCFP